MIEGPICDSFYKIVTLVYYLWSYLFDKRRIYIIYIKGNKFILSCKTFCCYILGIFLGYCNYFLSGEFSFILNSFNKCFLLIFYLMYKTRDHLCTLMNMTLFTLFTLPFLYICPSDTSLILDIVLILSVLFVNSFWL